MLQLADPHDRSERIDGPAAPVALVGEVHTEFSCFGKWPECCGLFAVAEIVVRDLRGVGVGDRVVISQPARCDFAR